MEEDKKHSFIHSVEKYLLNLTELALETLMWIHYSYYGIRILVKKSFFLSVWSGYLVNIQVDFWQGHEEKARVWCGAGVRLWHPVCENFPEEMGTGQVKNFETGNCQGSETQSWEAPQRQSSRTMEGEVEWLEVKLEGWAGTTSWRR